jgi:hypothetical protein
MVWKWTRFVSFTQSCVMLLVLTDGLRYYLTRVLETVGIKSPREQNIINGSLQIWNWGCAISSAFLSAHLKRRTQFLISVCGMLVVFSSQTLCAGLFNEHKNKAAGTGVIPMLFLFYTFYNLAFNALLYSYPVELLPYPIRVKGFSVLMFFLEREPTLSTPW